MSKKENFAEIIRYLLTGIIIGAVNWGSYFLFVDTAGLPVFWGNLFSWILTTLTAFVVNKFWVFKSYSMKARDLAREFVTFLSSRAVAGVIEVGGVPLLEKLGLDRAVFRLLEQIGLKYDLLFTDGLYSKLLIGLFILVFDYLMAKLVVFRKTKQKTEGAAVPEKAQDEPPGAEVPSAED